MTFTELTMPLSHKWMPDEVFPTSVKFFLGPKDHYEKGMVLGSDTGTCLTLPAVFSEFRETARLDAVPPEKFVLRETTVVDIAKNDREAITKADVVAALDTVQPQKGDAVLIRTGWGDRAYHELEGGSYLVQSPHLSLEAAQYLGQRLKDGGNDLLLVDSALLGLPDRHLIPEWCSFLPTPPVESGEARMYLHLYTAGKSEKDFAVELELARCGIMTIRKLVHCAQIKKDRIKIIVGPLTIVRGVASTCRVVAVED